MKQKFALVTGGSGGIGAAVSRQLAADGWTVVICYCRSHEKADALCREIRDSGHTAVLYQCAVEQEEAVKTMFDDIRSQYGKVTCLVNNAGISRDGYLMTQPIQDIEQTLSVNLMGTMHCCKAVMPHMISAKSGNIVNIASVAGMMGLSGQTAYSASKAAILGLTRSLAVEAARFGIRVNAVSPGYVDTEMLAAVPEKLRNDYMAAIPMKRFADAKEVANAVSWLCSPQCSYMTGQNLILDGGLSIA